MKEAWNKSVMQAKHFPRDQNRIPNASICHWQPRRMAQR